MPVNPTPPVESAARPTLKPGRRWARVARARLGHHARRTWTWFARRERSSSIDRAMTDAEQKGLGFHLRVRLALLTVVAVSLVAYYAPARSIPGLLVVTTFAASGLAQYLLGRRYGRPVFWAGVFSIFEAALFIGVILTPITFPASWPPQMQLRLPTVFYLFVYVAGTALSYSPRLVVWTGAVTIGFWGLGHQIMLRLPGTVSIHSPAIDKPGLSPIASLELYLDPLYVSDAAWRTQTVLLALLTAVLAAAVARSRGLLRRQVTDHLERASLSRYFSPNVVDALASAGAAGMAARRQPVAVLFADIRGFTHLSESLGTEATIELLTEFHQQVTRIVFDHRGTLEKYIGDAVMATFGTPSRGADDAGRALQCAWQLAEEAHRWSGERERRGLASVDIGIGVHYGEAVLGSIGDAHRLDFVVVGDTVNIESRLERLTRELDVELVVSNVLVPLQLDKANRTNSSQGMILLPDALIAVAKGAVDAAPPGHMVAVVRAGERGPSRDPEVDVDGVEPGGVGRRPDGVDVQASEQRQEARMVVDVVQVIHDDDQAFAGGAGPQPPECLAHLDDARAPAEHAAEAIGMHIVEPQELLGAFGPAIRGPQPLRPAPPGPGHPAQGLELQGPPLVEADHCHPRRTRPVQLADAFFFRSKAGSSEVFQVRMRWARSPSRRSSRRTHSSVIAGHSPRCRQYAASLGTVQAENGRPRSAGLDRAMSINSRIWGPVMIGRRPSGLAGRSKVRKPLSLNRCTPSSTMVTLQPTRSAASASAQPRATSALTRYRPWSRTGSRRSMTFACNNRRSLRVSVRSRTELAMLSPLGNSVCEQLHYSGQIKLDRH